ncbi:MAG: hypothetical protein Ct9H300mP1_20630 [Planctomycetaceae bacterium]|nr:MAG: hypothetical protein Ct9H300mP1_20630 [Planctomycetaceae bacterium]
MQTPSRISWTSRQRPRPRRACTASTRNTRENSVPVPGRSPVGRKGRAFRSVYHGAGSAGKWDAHNEIKKRYDREAPRSTSRSLDSSRISSGVDAREDAGRFRHRVRTDPGGPGKAGTIIRRGSPAGWPVAVSRGGSRTERPTNSGSMRSRTGTTSPTSRHGVVPVGFGSVQLEVPGGNGLTSTVDRRSRIIA